MLHGASCFDLDTTFAPWLSHICDFKASAVVVACKVSDGGALLTGGGALTDAGSWRLTSNHFVVGFDLPVGFRQLAADTTHLSEGVDLHTACFGLGYGLIPTIADGGWHRLHVDFR